jgi:hypothetical protein
LHVTVLISLGVVFWEIFHEAEPFGDQPNLNSDPRYLMMVCCNLLCFLSKICSELIKKLETQQIALKASISSCAALYVFLIIPFSLIRSFVKPPWSICLNL